MATQRGGALTGMPNPAHDRVTRRKSKALLGPGDSVGLQVSEPPRPGAMGPVIDAVSAPRHRTGGERQPTETRADRSQRSDVGPWQPAPAPAPGKRSRDLGDRTADEDSAGALTGGHSRNDGETGATGGEGAFGGNLAGNRPGPSDIAGEQQTEPAVAGRDQGRSGGPDPFDPDARVTVRDVDRWVASASRDFSVTPYDPVTTPGLRPLGSGIGFDRPMLAWDEAANGPVASPAGGYYVVLAHPEAPRMGLARDTATGEYLLWSVEEGRYWPDRDGDPVPVDPATLRDGALDPAGIAAVMIAAVEVDALADAAPVQAEARVQAAQDLLADARNPDHPLHPFLPMLGARLPAILQYAASGAHWSHRGTSRKAADLAEMAVSELTAGLRDPAKGVQQLAQQASDPGGDRDAEAGDRPQPGGEGGGADAGDDETGQVLNSSASGYSTQQQDDGSFVLWDEQGGRPVSGDEGGTLTGRVQDESGRFAIMVDSATGSVAIYDQDRGAFVADSSGAAIRVSAEPARLALDEETDFAHKLAANVVSLSLSRTKQERAAAARALEAMLREMDDENHLFHHFGPPVRQFVADYFGLMDPSALVRDETDRAEQALRLASGLVTSVLDPEFVETAVVSQLARGTVDLEALSRRFASVTGYALVENTDGAGSLIVQDAAGTPVVHIPQSLVAEFIVDPQGANNLDTLAAWQAGEIGATEAASRFLTAFDGTADEEFAGELGDAIYALEEAIGEGTIDRSQAATLLIPALYPGTELPIEFIQDLILDTLPIIGNIRSAEAFVEDIEAVGLAIENEDWWAASGNALLAVLDLAGAIPGLGLIFRPIKNGLLRIARHSSAFRKAHSRMLLLWMGHRGRHLEPSTRVQDYFGGVWPQLTSEQQASFSAIFPRIIGDAGEQRTYDLLEQSGRRVVTWADIDQLADLPADVVVTQPTIRRSGSPRTFRRPDAAIRIAGDLMEIVFMRGRPTNTPFGELIESKVGGSWNHKQVLRDKILTEEEITEGVHILRARLREIEPSYIIDAANRHLSSERFSFLTNRQREMIIEDINGYFDRSHMDPILFDFFIGLELRAMISLDDAESTLEPID